MAPQIDNNEPQTMQELLDSIEFKVLRRGEIVEGTVMRVDSDGLFVNIGHKEEGFVPPNEMRTLTAEEAGQRAMDAGMREIEVYVKGPGSGRDAAVRALESAGLSVLSISDITPIPHNGPRPPKRRRV